MARNTLWRKIRSKALSLVPEEHPALAPQGRVKAAGYAVVAEADLWQLDRVPFYSETLGGCARAILSLDADAEFTVRDGDVVFAFADELTDAKALEKLASLEGQVHRVLLRHESDAVPDELPVDDSFVYQARRAQRPFLVARYLSSRDRNADIGFVEADFVIPGDEGIRARGRADLNVVRHLAKTHRGKVTAPRATHFNNFFVGLRAEAAGQAAESSEPDGVIDAGDRAALEEELSQIDAQLAGIEGERCFVTITSDGYEWGTICLVTSLRRYHNEPVVVFHSGPADLGMIRQNLPADSNVHFIDTKPLFVGTPDKLSAQYSNTLIKFHILAMERFQSLVFLDSDMIVLDALDEVFPTDSRIKATATYDNDLECSVMHVSILGVRPSKDLFWAFIANALKSRYDGKGDHGYFIDFFRDDWELLDISYNLSHKMLAAGPADRLADAKAIHFHGFKPWGRAAGGGAWIAAYGGQDIWFDQLSLEQRSEMQARLRVRQAQDVGLSAVRDYRKRVAPSGDRR